MSRTFDVAVVGATGAVGEVMLEILAERKVPVGKVYPLASERSAGSKVRFGDRMLTVQNLADFDFSKTQIGLFSAGASISKVFRRRVHIKGVCTEGCRGGLCCDRHHLAVSL
jgi:aspartate-semialdehyde dehydrogenase